MVFVAAAFVAAAFVAVVFVAVVFVAVVFVAESAALEGSAAESAGAALATPVPAAVIAAPMPKAIAHVLIRPVLRCRITCAPLAPNDDSPAAGKLPLPVGPLCVVAVDPQGRHCLPHHRAPQESPASHAWAWWSAMILTVGRPHAR